MKGETYVRSSSRVRGTSLSFSGIQLRWNTSRPQPNGYITNSTESISTSKPIHSHHDTIYDTHAIVCVARE